MTAREELKEMLENLNGWTTVREELADAIKEFVDMNLVYNAYEIYDEGESFGLWIEDEYGEEFEFSIMVGHAGSTWYIDGVRF